LRTPFPRRTSEKVSLPTPHPVRPGKLRPPKRVTKEHNKIPNAGGSCWSASRRPSDLLGFIPPKSVPPIRNLSDQWTVMVPGRSIALQQFHSGIIQMAPSFRLKVYIQFPRVCSSPKLVISLQRAPSDRGAKVNLQGRFFFRTVLRDRRLRADSSLLD